MFYLVASGATIKKQTDWERLVESPLTALQIAQGIHKRDVGRLEKLQKVGQLHLAKAEDYMASIRIPMTAFCMDDFMTFVSCSFFFVLFLFFSFFFNTRRRYHPH